MNIIIAKKFLRYISTKNRIVSIWLEKIIPIFYLIGILILVLPFFLKTNFNKKQFFANFLIWLVVIFTVILMVYFLF